MKAAIWENQTENGPRHNITVSRLYKDGVDALTRLAGSLKNAGDRTAADLKGASLLALAA